MKAIDSLQPLKWYAHCLSLEKNAGYVRCREQRRMNVSLHDTSFRVWCFEVSYFMSIVINSFGIFLSRFTSFLKILKRSSLPEANKISLSTTREFFKRWWNILSLITIEKKKVISSLEKVLGQFWEYNVQSVRRILYKTLWYKRYLHWHAFYVLV